VDLSGIADYFSRCFSIRFPPKANKFAFLRPVDLSGIEPELRPCHGRVIPFYYRPKLENIVSSLMAVSNAGSISDFDIGPNTSIYSKKYKKLQRLLIKLSAGYALPHDGA
jgi:hypothetical protein